PTSLLSPDPPISAVFPSPDSATLQPMAAPLVRPVPIRADPCWAHVLPDRTKTYAAPTSPLVNGAPISAVLPSHDSATLQPKNSAGAGAVSFGPSCVQVPPARVNTHAEPESLSLGPPTSTVPPSPDTATRRPNWPGPLSFAPVSFDPCWMNGSIRSG